MTKNEGTTQNKSKAVFFFDRLRDEWRIYDTEESSDAFMGIG